MLAFFRKIRQKLFQQQPEGKAGNRVTRYLVYAIGEIILVVIGILIALQVNNWNESRKQKEELKLFYKGLLADLVKDTIEINRSIENYKFLLDYNQNLENSLHNPLSNLDTFQSVATRFNPYIGNSFFSNQTTLNSFESSGKLELIDDTIRYKLLEYKSLTEKIFNLDQTNSSIYQDRVALYSQNYQFREIKSPYLQKLNVIKDER